MHLFLQASLTFQLVQNTISAGSGLRLSHLRAGSDFQAKQNAQMHTGRPMCELPSPDGSGHKLGVFVVHGGLFDNFRAIQFIGDGVFEQTQARCEGSVPDGCSKNDPENRTLSCESVDCPCTPTDELFIEYMKSMMRQIEPACQQGGADGGSYRVLLVGLGGGALPPYILSHCPSGTHVDSVEYDSRYVTVATKFFGLNLTQGINEVEVGEGGAVVADRVSKGVKYDAVLVDAFMTKSKVPPSCRSDTFVDNVKTLLSPGGVAMQNIVSPEFEDTRDIYRAHFGEDNVDSEDFDSHEVHHNHLIIARVPK